MKEVYELKDSEKLSDGAYLEMVRSQLLTDIKFTKKDIKRAEQRVKEYSSEKHKDTGLQKAAKIMADKYSVWVNELYMDLNRLEQLYLNTKLKMYLGGF